MNQIATVTDKEKADFYGKIGSNIKAAREKKGVKQHVLAEMLGLSRASVVNIEKGRQHVSIHALWHISTLLTASFSTLLDGLGQQGEIKYPTHRMKFDDSITSQTEKDAITKDIEHFITILNSTNHAD